MDDFILPQHHEKLLSSSKERTDRWERETIGQEASRCSVCWLRLYQCYCHEISAQRMPIQPMISKLADAAVEIVIFYNFVEIGRSANTAHVFHALCPEITQQIIYGDRQAEQALLTKIIEEKHANVHKTCVLYPSSSSISLSKWLDNVTQSSSNAIDAASSNCTMPSIRLILLDGTYPGASRVARFLSEASAANGLNLPCVALDLDAAIGCKSAVAGVMYQPAKDKICTFQAIALALQQLITHSTVSPPFLTTELIGLLLGYLDCWITALLEKRVKLGKSKGKPSLKDVDNSPAHYVQQIMVPYPIPPPACALTTIYEQ